MTIKPLGASILNSLAAMRAHASAPDGLERAAKAQADKDTKARQAITERANTRRVPANGDLREIAVDENPPLTPVLKGMRAVMAWRRARAKAKSGSVAVTVYVSSPVGRGKTAAASHLVMRHRRDALYVTASEIALTVRNGHSDPEAHWKRWESVDLLVVDELGTDARSVEPMVALMLQRHLAGTATLLLGNLSPDDFFARYGEGLSGERLADRLLGQKAEGCGWFFVDKGPSFRLPKNREGLSRPERKAPPVVALVPSVPVVPSERAPVTPTQKRAVAVPANDREKLRECQRKLEALYLLPSPDEEEVAILCAQVKLLTRRLGGA